MENMLKSCESQYMYRESEYQKHVCQFPLTIVKKKKSFDEEQLDDETD